MDDSVLKAIIATFSAEAEELAQLLTHALLELEKSDNGAEALGAAHGQLRRGLHTLKGSAATVGFVELSTLVHQMEELLVTQSQATPLPRPLVDAFFSALDTGLQWVRAKASQRTDLPDLEAIRATLVVAGASVNPGGAEAPRTARPGAPAAKAPAHKVGARRRWGPRNTAAAPAPDVEIATDGWRVKSSQVASLMGDVERLRELSLRLGEQGRDVARCIEMLPRALLGEAADDLRGRLLGTRFGLSSDAAEMSALVDSMEECLKAICTLPFKMVIEPLHRAVRDLTFELGKEAKISAVGAEAALDRRLLDALRAPLLQLVRNAVDHGIETPAAREKAGKHREAIIAIRVEQVGNEVFIELSDDGAGLDEERIRSTAVSRDLVRAEEAARLDTNQLSALIFRPGFTTRSTATDVSGRGVGLDIVAEAVRGIRGRIEVHSVRGQGTRFVLTFPAELGSSPLMVVGVADQVFGIPMHAVRKALPAHPSKVRAGRSRMGLEHEGAVLPLEDLGGLLGIRQPMSPGEGQPVLIVSAEGREAALAVDTTFGDQWPVVRPLPQEVRQLEQYLGAATLSRGQSILVLRPSWLLESRTAEVTTTRRILVVDDSLTARAVHRAVLESGGYTAHGAASAQQALEHLRQGTYEAIVCDVDLGEGMNGIALTALVRSRPELKDVPVVLVSSHDQEAERRRGHEAGADGFISKKDCVAGMLLSEIGTAIGRRRGKA
jgi:chemotaxis protein histidine kinase CheA